jgi:manganese transport protein
MAGGFIRYIGPALIVSTAYIDPGNFGTDIAGGAIFAYDILWVVWLASIMAMVLQYLSGKLGLATGRSLAELLREKLKSRGRIVAYWLACEIFAVFTDLAEFLGVALGLYLLFGIPLLIAAWISAFDVIFIFLLAGKKFRHIEILIANFVTVIGVGYVYDQQPIIIIRYVSVGTGDRHPKSIPRQVTKANSPHIQAILPPDHRNRHPHYHQQN